MAEEQRKNNNDIDLDVFRVPPKEMLEKISQTPQQSSRGKNFEQKKVVSKEVASKKPDAQVPVSPPLAQSSTDSLQSGISSNVYPKKAFSKPFFSSSKPKKAFLGRTQSKSLPPKPSSPPVAKPPVKSVKPVKPKLSGWKKAGLVAILVFFLLILSATGLVWAEWQGLISIGASRVVGPPPAQMIWSKAVVFRSPLSFTGKVVFNNPSDDLKKWLKDQGLNQQEISFSGQIIIDNKEVSGVWQWLDESPFVFYLKDQSLYLKRNKEESWSKVDLGFSFQGIDPFLEFLNNYSNFQRLKADEGFYWYKGVFSYALLSGWGIYPEVEVALSDQDFTLSRLKLLTESTYGLQADFLFQPSDFSLGVKAEDIDKAKDGNEEFAKVVSFIDLWQKQKKENTASDNGSFVTLRDKQRKDDLQLISQALRNYYQEKSSYPVAEEKIKIEEADNLWSVLEPYLPEGEEWSFADPKYPDFYYGYISDGENYELSARLENKEDKEGIAIGDIVLYFIVSNESYNPSLAGF